MVGGEGVVQLYDTCLRQVASSSEMSAQYLLHTSFAAKAIRVKRILLHLGERNAYEERERGRKRDCVVVTVHNPLRCA